MTLLISVCHYRECSIVVITVMFWMSLLDPLLLGTETGGIAYPKCLHAVHGLLSCKPLLACTSLFSSLLLIVSMNLLLSGAETGGIAYPNRLHAVYGLLSCKPVLSWVFNSKEILKWVQIYFTCFLAEVNEDQPCLEVQCTAAACTVKMWDNGASEFKGQDDAEVQKCLQTVYQVTTQLTDQSAPCLHSGAAHSSSSMYSQDVGQ